MRLTLTRVATISVPIVAETCARRGAGFSRFLQLVPGEEESQTTGKLCVLHFALKALVNIASLCNRRTNVLREVLESEMDLRHWFDGYEDCMKIEEKSWHALFASMNMVMQAY
jgi:hypothetical protein